ncbi:hypothetical protein JKF63_01273 [Porcisia hertigi]|uniref:Uncharacterized protein n=1 Tax=Porcisia hertigi TaxID=2761500 RepID=A0A836KZG7_9TRYP|nr:hypothetical protein JKF63_01273 [Porcisia hertigi]
MVNACSTRQMPPLSSPPTPATIKDAATYMDHCLRDKVRLTLQTCLLDRPRDPVQVVAQGLREMSEHDVPSHRIQEPSGVLGDYTEAPSVHPSQWSAPPLLRLEDGAEYKLRPLSYDFRRAAGKPPLAEATLPAPVFPSVEYREAMPSYEVASRLRELHLMDPEAPLVLLVECPALTSGVFFYEGVPYACGGTNERPGNPMAPPSVTALQKVLGEEKVRDFDALIRAAAVEAVDTVHTTLLPSLQVDYLTIFDALENALDTAMQARGVSEANSSGQPSCSKLPSVLFVSYKPDTAHLTYSRLLASYGPRYEAAQRASLKVFRAAQLERKRTYTFAYALDYWSKVQRARETCPGPSRTRNSIVRAVSPYNPKVRTNERASPTLPGESTTSSALADKRSAAKPTKRGLLAYDTVHQTEDSMFLVVVRRLEHAAATLIQSVYRGYRARRSYTHARAASRMCSGAVTDSSLAQCTTKAAGGAESHVDAVLPPLMRACLERLYREGEAFGSLWGDYATSPPPESRRCWIYRPVQRQHNVSDMTQSGVVGNTGAQVLECWVQEELLLPPWRATQPRLHLNLLQRLKDYLTLAQCTSLHDNVRLLLDAPGMSVLQRRAYDGIKSMCLSLFHVAYTEVRQRQANDLPMSFSAYMRQNHAIVLGWFSFPHECSLLVRAMQRTTTDVDPYTPQSESSSGEVGGRESAAERSMMQVVQNQLAVNETLVTVPHSLSVNLATVSAATPAVSILAPQLYISQAPLLPHKEWGQAVAAVLQSVGARATGACAPSLEWMTTANFPLCCCAGRTPVAAMPRLDTQRIEGAQPYDSFVPRVHASTPPFTCAGAAKDLGTGAGTFPATSDVPTTAAVQEWLQGCLACAADVGLKTYLHNTLASEGGLVYYRAPDRKGGVATYTFPTVSPWSTLVREVLRLDDMDSPAYPSERPPSKLSVSELRSEEANEEQAEVTDAVVQEGVTAVRRRSSRFSADVTIPSTHDSVSRQSVATWSSLKLETREIKDDAVQFLTADEVAKEVGATLEEISFKHTRVSLRFSAGITALERLDSFLNHIAESLQYEPNSSLVLAMDLPSQAFYALAAAIFVFRLHDTRDIPAWWNSNAAVTPAVSTSREGARVSSESRVSFLSGFHDVLEKAFPSPQGSRGGLHCTAVQMAALHVSQVMNCAPFSELDLIAGIRCAVQEAEEAAEAGVSPSHSVIRATQLAEQYALLVLLDYYLWSSQSCFTPVMSSFGNCSKLPRMAGRCAFANFVKNVPAALDWIAKIDPWRTSAPDALRLRYSNALRRWDDKHYVCFGAL